MRAVKVLLLIVLSLGVVAQAGPKNVIFFIGDGMGPEQVKAGGMYLYGSPGTLSFELLPYQGELTTYQFGGGVTDSAAAATALATGYKVNGGVISMAYPGNIDYAEGAKLPTLLEYYQGEGKSTGLVTTAYVTHATPAGFGAHETSRNNYAEIADDYLTQTKPNVLFGGSSYMSEAAGAGYTVVTSAVELFALDADAETMVSGQFGGGYMPYEADGLGALPHLSEMTTVALDVLDKDADGFFLMVEGGRIDHACHDNSNKYADEVVEFANAVQVAIDWAAGRTDTLILVTADHETGGLTITGNNGAGTYPTVTWTSTGHTAANVPVYAWGVNAELIFGVMDNTDMFGVVVSDEPIELVSPAYDALGVSTSPNLEVRVQDPDGTGDPLDVTFFGREKPFTIIAIGDTQNYAQSGTKAIYDAQIQWIANNAASMNIVFVTHQGDIVDAWDNTTEWANANDSMSLLDGVVPYGLLPGNHDQPNLIDNKHDPYYFNQTFPYTRYQGLPWYGGHFPTAGNENNYQLFSAGGDDYVILHLEDWPDDGSPGSVIAWADSILTAHAGRKAIITTHGYLTTSGGYSGKWGSTQYIRDNLVEAHDNVYFVLCGHSGEYTKTTTVGTRDIHELLSCYHADGWLRIMTFDPDADEVHVQTYSPWLDQYQTTGGSDFVLSYDMTSVGYSPIGSDLNVASGSVATTAWPDLSMETQYEWYVTVTDDTVGTTPGPVWSFTTGSPKASNPNPANGATDVDVDADLSWSAGIDANSHDVYFGTDAASLPLVSSEQPGITYDPGTLDQGLTYYWAIDEHNSVGGVTPGDIWTFTTTLPQPVSIVSAGATWKYFDHVDSDQGAWYEPSFDDSSWAEGPAELGYGDGDEATAIDGSPIRASYYFRHSFTAVEAYDNLILNVVRDDGTVVYLNGVELGRSNMPGGEIYWDTWSLAVTTNENDWWGISVDPAVTIQPGVNVLAVSVHQAHSTSSDVSFNLELLGVPLAVGQPVAAAGPDQTVGDSDGDNVETVTLDGSDSYDPDGTIVSYEWDIDGDQITDYTGETVLDVPLDVGTHTITLTVTDDEEATDSDDVVITVNANQEPVADAGPDQTVTDLDQNGNETVTLDGSASSDPDGTIDSYEWDIDGDQITDYTGETVLDVPLDVGTHTITLTVTDNGSASGTDDVVITVDPPGPTTLFSDGFESGNLATGDWTSSGSVLIKEPAAYEGVYGVQIGGIAWIEKSFSTVGFSDIRVKYARKTKGIDSGESLTVEWFDGTAWNVIELTPDTAWAQRDIALGAGAGENAAFSVRFRTNANKTNEYGAVDSVEITGTPSGPVNQPPVANNDAYSVDEDGTLIIEAPGVLGNDSDPESNPLTAVPVGGAGNGALSLNPDGSFSYTPNANFNGEDSFTYMANDGVLNSDTATVTITVNPINDAPVANNDSATTNEDAAVVIDVLANDTDADPTDTLSVQSVTQGTNGSVVNNGVSVTYTPDLGFVGEGTFSYTVSDGNGGTDTATVSVTVTEFNNPPVATDDADSTNEDAAVVIDVLANDTDADLGDTLSVQSATNGSNGSVSNNGGDSVTYTPNANFNGTDVFTYTVSDGNGGMDTGSVTVTVLAVNDPPSAGDDSAATDEDTAVVVDVLANDSDIDGDTLSVQSATNGSNGIVVVNGDNTVTYTPDADYSGDDSFTYTVADGKGGTDTATVTITVNPAGSIVYVESIAMLDFVPAGRNSKAVAGITLNAPEAGATVVGDWYFKGEVIQTGASGTTDAGGYTEIVSVPVKAKTGDVFRFVITNVALSGYTYDSNQGVTENSITFP